MRRCTSATNLTLSRSILRVQPFRFGHRTGQHSQQQKLQVASRSSCSSLLRGRGPLSHSAKLEKSSSSLPAPLLRTRRELAQIPDQELEPSGGTLAICVQALILFWACRSSLALSRTATALGLAGLADLFPICSADVAPFPQTAKCSIGIVGASSVYHRDAFAILELESSSVPVGIPVSCLCNLFFFFAVLFRHIRQSTPSSDNWSLPRFKANRGYIRRGNKT